MFSVKVPGVTWIRAFHPATRDPEARQEIAAEIARLRRLLAGLCQSVGLQAPRDEAEYAHLVGQLGLNTADPPTINEVVIVLAETAAKFAFRPPRREARPSKDRISDILATIKAAGMPLTRPELVRAMRLKVEGRIGSHLSWLTRHGILANIPGRGYWPAGEPVPE